MKLLNAMTGWIKRATKFSIGTPADPVLKDILGFGAETTAGVDVTERSAMTNMAVLACIRNISEDVAKLPLNLFERLPDDGGKKRLVGHPLHRLIHDSPNDDMSSYAFRETMTGWAASWGNAYAEIERAGAMPKALHILPANMVTPKRLSGRLVYEVREINNDVTTLDAINVLHIRWFGGDGIVGWSPIRMAAETIGLGIAVKEYGARFFGNDATPGGVLQHPGKLGPEAADYLKRSWQEKHSRGQQHRVAVLEEGMTWQTIGLHAKDTQLLQTMEFNIVDVARLYRMPPHKIQHLLNATFSNIEHQSREYVQDTLQPWLERWEQEYDRKLVLPSDRDRMFIEHNVDGMLRGDTAARGTFYNQQFMIGAMTINEIRAKENMGPVDNGDIHFVPMNMVPLDQAAEGPPEPEPAPALPEPVDADPDEQEDDGDRSVLRDHLKSAYTELIAHELRAVLKLEHDKTRRAAKKDGYNAWCDNFYDEHRLYVRGKLGSVIDRAALALFKDYHPADDLMQSVGMWLTGFAQDHTKRSLELLEAGEDVLTDERINESASRAIQELEELLCPKKPPNEES